MKEVIIKSLNISELSINEIEKLIEIPKDNNLGDYTFPCYVLASKLRKNANDVAKELVAKIKPPREIEKISVIGPYINFFVNYQILVQKTLNKIFAERDNYGFKKNKRGTIIIEMSSPNISKPFGIGHLRSTIIGNCLAKIYRAIGYKVVTINYLGDWGTPFGKIIAAYKKWGDENKLKKNPMRHMLELYVKANSQKKFEALGREYFLKMENGDKEILKIWEDFRKLSIENFNEIYRMLDIHFDVISGESFYNKKSNEIIKLLDKKKLLEKSNGAVIINLEKYNLGICLIKKSDGASLYVTRDIAAAIDRQKKYKADKLIYEVGSEQKLHFKQLFKILELMGYKWAKNCVHVDHGLYLDKDGKKFATRKGKTIFMKEIFDETINLAKQEIIKRLKKQNQEKNISEADLNRRAKAIAKAAIIYGDLKNYRSNDMIFDINRFVSFEGDTGPYLLYSYARARSIIKKSKTKIKKIDYPQILTQNEKNLIKKVYIFSEILVKTAEQYAPNILANYAYSLAQTFNEFYHSEKVIDSENEIFRLALVDAFSQVMKNSLNLMGIDVLEEM